MGGQDKLQVEYGQEHTSKTKVAVLYAMTPKDLQERYSMHVCGQLGRDDGVQCGSVVREGDEHNQELGQGSLGHARTEADGGGQGVFVMSGLVKRLRRRVGHQDRPQLRSQEGEP
jgi:hypothetical protein